MRSNWRKSEKKRWIIKDDHKTSELENFTAIKCKFYHV